MTAYQLTDAWFVSRLGTEALAAMAFTFPVIMALSFIARGLGTSAMTLIANALGRRRHDEAATLTTHALLLALLVVVVGAVGGFLTMKPVFLLLGADARTFPLIEAFMRIWYAGIAFMVIPMLGNDIIISAGETKTASLVMVSGTVVNAILNPILIFGAFGLPALGIRGSAWATLVSQALSTLGVLLLLNRKLGLVAFSSGALRGVWRSWARILRIGVPTILGNLLMPLASTLITSITARFGAAAVAASGAASRLEMFAFMVPMTFGMTMIPFVGQNHGAGRMDRILLARRFTTRFAFVYGLVVAVAAFLAAPWLAGLFSTDPEVCTYLVWYLRIIPFGYGLMEIHRYSGFFLIGVQRAVTATVLTSLRLLALLVPLSYAGAWLGGIRGLYFGRLLCDLCAGCLGFCVAQRIAVRMHGREVGGRERLPMSDALGSLRDHRAVR